MAKVSRDFQVFAKPVGSVCNLECEYCYYLSKKHLYPEREVFRMPDDVLEAYIVQLIDACTEPVINFSWHGGEPTLLGLDYFRKIVSLQQKHQPAGRRISNSIQTNGTLLDEDWCRFFAGQRFSVGLSLDGPQELHDRFRRAKNQEPTHAQVMRAYHLLRQHNVLCDILCVVHAENVLYPARVYQFFKQINAEYLGFLPLVERRPESETGVSHRSVPPKALGNFLATIFDEWKRQDIGRIKIQMFEEVARTAFKQDHSLCIFRKTCGDIPVVEHNGDFFSCDHFVDEKHCLGNIREVSLVELLESPEQRAFGQAKLDRLTRYCRACEVREMCHGGCPKDRFILTPDGEPGLSYLCSGYKHFFIHCLPFVAELSKLWHRQSREKQVSSVPVRDTRKTGRNAPCPCGSGRKYKKCCLNR